MKCVLLLIFLVALVFPSSVFALDSPIIISEFLPNPLGDDAVGEWIELQNTSSETVALDGWVLSDVYGTIKNFPLNGMHIDSGVFLVAHRSETQITLNNDTEQLILSGPNGELFTSAVVSNPVEGKSYAFVQGGWEVMSPTPGQASTVLSTPTPQPNSSPTLPPSPSPTVPPSPSPQLVQNLQLSEVLACGATTEWVELYNPNPFQVFLEGWRLQDSTTQSKSLEGMSIPPEGYVVKEWSGYFLNNGGDEVRLFHGDDLVDTFTYESCTDGFTWARHANVWERTSALTKSDVNQFVGSVQSSPTPLPSISPSISTEVLLGSPLPESSTPAQLQRSQIHAELPTISTHSESLRVSAVTRQDASPLSTVPEAASPQRALSLWYLSAGCWLFSSAGLMLRNATMKYVFNSS